jgi:hypothetical protein
VPEKSEVEDAIRDHILKAVKEEWPAVAIRDLAEAYAWVSVPNNSHGGHSAGS